MFVIKFFDVYNDVKSTKKMCKPINCETLLDVNSVQEKIQIKQQKIHGEDARVLVHYVNTNKFNPKSDNIGFKDDYTLNKWI